ncbi:heavy metal translocating P-type ATPase [Fodinibius sp. AD559]|uniref:heavy metal translocating P-type ATPase n=1 Tax=Fodinibius sp. AD559 TaxID=3424179 RepID=UPI004046B2F8
MQFVQNFYNSLLNPSKRKKILLIISGSLIVTGWVAGSVFSSAILFNLLMILSALIAGFEIGQRAWQGLRNRHTNIELLVTIAAIGGLAIGVYWEAAAVTFLFLLGGWLEARTMHKTRSTLRQLINMAPDTATVIENDSRKEIPAREVEPDMLVLVKPGSKIPVDGVVESGVSAVDESAITGEPIPAEKNAGTEVYAGTMNKNGRLYVRAAKAGAETTLAKIIRRVEEAQEEKAPTQRFIERFAQWYTPGIIGLSIGSFLFTWDLELALTLLVIGCPGALVISTPISIISGIGRAAKKGILIKGGEYLENAGKISAVAFDKTGTLTKGTPRITDLVVVRSSEVMAGLGPDRQELPGVETLAITDQKADEMRDEFQQLMYWAAVAETDSEHPLAKAILSKAKQTGSIPEPEHFESHTGLGVEAVYNDNQILVGKQEFLQKRNIPIDENLEQEFTGLTKKGRTVVLVARNGRLLGGIGIADQIRSEAPEMVHRLRETGIDRIIMLTGDSKSTARAIADEVGIEEIYAGILPEEKNNLIKKMKKEGDQVAMVGDGINDAPALASADIGIAMGAAGTDVAIETADIALMADELMNIPEALWISKLTLRNIYQNVAMALFTVGALLAGVFMGSVHMAAGMLIHELSVMLVILNGMRLRWI